jgi:hypothetical protein
METVRWKLALCQQVGRDDTFCQTLLTPVQYHCFPSEDWGK